MHYLRVLILLTVIILSLPMFAFVTYDTHSWMNGGSFAEYSFKSVGLSLNGTTLFFDKNYSVVFRWECVEINCTLAKLSISFSINLENGSSKYSTNVYANIVNRTIFLQNGTSIGETRLWSASNPKQTEPITLLASNYNINSSSIIAYPEIEGFSSSPQGWQEAYTLRGEGKIYGHNDSIIAIYDVDTGVMLRWSVFLESDPVLRALGITATFRNGELKFAATNINLGPGSILPDILHQLPLIVISGLVMVFTSLTGFMYKRLTQKTLKRKLRH